ncbi:MAG TPA: DUF2309 domain-containing protein [Nitrospiria bacterium]|nr:DUF2309 domain-containing protein [Nitrospiria bacterium]
MEPLKTAAYNDTQRMRLRGVILIAGEIVAPYWPMRTFVHHNPLHGLEDLHFEEAVRRGRRLLGGSGYLSNELFRDYHRSGRILPNQIDAALRPLAQDIRVTLGNRKVTHFEVLRAELLHGIGVPADETVSALIDRLPDRAAISALADYLRPVLKPATGESSVAPEPLGRASTLAVWCDRALGTQITERIDREMIKWCEAFLDEDHAAWSMPGREKGFYGAWKWLAGREWSPCAIPDSRRKLARLPDAPEDALLESIDALGIPSEAWPDYLSHHLTALPGWAGFIKWRSDQADYEWQQAYPADLVQYLAVRVWYEQELVRQACREELGIDGTISAIATEMQKRGNPGAQSAREGEALWTLPTEGATRAPLTAAWRLKALADALEIDPAVLTETPQEDLMVLIDWIDAFPESDHGPVWLRAFEAGYQERLINKLLPNAVGPKEGAEGGHPPVRPQSQAVFCIDVRSESFRRHLEAVGDYHTFGFAGFFSVFIRYQALGSRHETDQFPVIMKAKNTVRETPRTYQGEFLARHRSRAQLVQTGHTLLHDLKENVVTPYVAVESLGWFYGLPLVGRTVFTTWYQIWTDWLRRTFVPTVATAMTVDKLSRKEVEEMLAAEQRAVIRRALQERFGDRDLNLSLERLEFLRQRALEESGGEPVSGRHPPKGSLSPEEEAAFVQALRDHYRINPGGAFARMERITRIGFTAGEQAFTVETALRMMGLTGNFARLVLFCGHGSTSDNNPFEAALDCGACGGNAGKPNARVLAAMANKPTVREALARNGIAVPQDTYFIAGQHETTTDTVQIFDLEDLPHTHLNDLLRLSRDLEEAGRRNSRERCSRFPEIAAVLPSSKAAREARRRSGDWSEVRPEWGLSGNAAFIVGRRELIRGVDLEGRVFLHSYDHREDPAGRFLEIIMTGPQVVGQWISMEHYFSTVDPEVYGSGSKIYHNIVGRFGVMSGPQSDLRTGLARQTVMNGPRPFHEPLRMLTLIEAPRDRIAGIIRRHRFLQHLYDNEWVRLAALDPEEKIFYDYIPRQGWRPVNGGEHP